MLTNIINKEEIEANQFALELLMPREMILTHANKYKNEKRLSDKQFLVKMCKTFQVTEIAMITRLLNLGILTSI